MIKNIQRNVLQIVEQANLLKNKYTNQRNAPVNYACIFSQSEKEFEDCIKQTKKLGKIIHETPSGPLFKIDPLRTDSGVLQLLKIRNPDKTRPEKGDADFTVENYTEFKKKYLQLKGFKLIQKEDFEMIELMDASFNVRAYFSNPPLDLQLKIK